MKEFLLSYLGRIMPNWQNEQHFLLITHEGKSDLDKSIPRKLKGWQQPDDCFIVLRDNDGADCITVKNKIIELIPQTHRSRVTIRLVCQELESWYLGDKNALKTTYPESHAVVDSLIKKNPDPDKLKKPSDLLKKNIPNFQKNDAARRIGRLLDANTNKSHSFIVFSSSLTKISSKI